MKMGKKKGKGGKCKMMMMGMLMMIKLKLIGNGVASFVHLFSCIHANIFLLFEYRFAVQSFKTASDYKI